MTEIRPGMQVRHEIIGAAGVYASKGIGTVVAKDDSFCHHWYVHFSDKRQFSVDEIELIPVDEKV